MIISPHDKVVCFLTEMLDPVRQRLATYTLKYSLHFAKKLSYTYTSGKLAVF